MEKTLMQGRDFILFGLQPWDIPIGSNFKNMAEEIGKNNRVLYVNKPLDRISVLRKRKDPQIQTRMAAIKHGKDVLTEVLSNVWVFNPRSMVESINFLSPGKLYNFLQRRNNKRLATEIKWAAKELDFKDYIVIIDNDFFNGQYLKEFIGARTFIYYIRDYLIAQKYFQRHGPKAEAEIMKKADAVLTNSQYLADYAGKNNKISINIGQGCDVEDFLIKPDSAPEDIAQIQRPVIGYCGAIISSRLDIKLIHHVAKTKPEWQIVLVGPQDEDFRNSGLHKMKNVHFLGSKDISEVPGYVHYFDVCINPQIMNPTTIGNYPRKVDEYLAAGKPVVALKTQGMDIFAEQCFLCSTYPEYVDAITIAIKESNHPEKIEQRKELAKSHTWEASMGGLYKVIENLEMSDHKKIAKPLT
jgi:teichuronic acid biosynthesis glycosyltransferase TuaH